MLQEQAHKAERQHDQSMKTIKSASGKFVHDNIPAYCQQIFPRPEDSKQRDQCIKDETRSTQKLIHQPNHKIKSSGSNTVRPHTLAVIAGVIFVASRLA